MIDRDEQRRLAREAQCTSGPVIPVVPAPSTRPDENCSVVERPIETFEAPEETLAAEVSYDLGVLEVRNPTKFVACSGDKVRRSEAGQLIETTLETPVLEGSVSWLDIPLITDSQLAFIASLSDDTRNPFGITSYNSEKDLAEALWTVEDCATTLKLTTEQASWLKAAVEAESNQLLGQAATLAESQLDCGYLSQYQLAECKDIDGTLNGEWLGVPAGSAFSYVSQEDANEMAKQLGLSALAPCLFPSPFIMVECQNLVQENVKNEWLFTSSDTYTVTVNGKPATVYYDEFSDFLLEPVRRVTRVDLLAGSFQSTIGYADAEAQARVFGESLLVCWLTATTKIYCHPPTALGVPAEPANGIPGNEVDLPAGLVQMADLSAEMPTQAAQDLAETLAASLLVCEWSNARQQVDCEGSAEVMLPDGSIVSPSLSPSSFSGIVEEAELTVAAADVPSDYTDPQIYIDEQALALAYSRRYCLFCNAEVPAYCLPDGAGDPIPVIPLTSGNPGYGPQPEGAAISPLNPYYWSIDATVGVAAGLFCEEDPASAQGAANAIGVQPFVASVDFADEETCSYGNDAMSVTCKESVESIGKQYAELLYNKDTSVMIPADFITITKGDVDNLEKPPTWSDEKWADLSGSERLWKELANEMAVMQAQSLMDCKWANVAMDVYCGTTDLISEDFYMVDESTGEAVYRDYAETYRFGDAGLHGALMVDGPHEGGTWPNTVVFADGYGSEMNRDITGTSWPWDLVDTSLDPETVGPYKAVMIKIPDDFVDAVHPKSKGSKDTPISIPRWTEFSYDSPMEADKLALQSGISRLDCFVKNVEMTAACAETCTDILVDPPEEKENKWGKESVAFAVTDAGTIESRTSQYEADAMAKLEAQNAIECIAWNEEQNSECQPGEYTRNPVRVKAHTVTGATICEANITAKTLADSLAECQSYDIEDEFSHPWMVSYSQESGQGTEMCPSTKVMARDSILYDFDGITELFVLTNTLSDETATASCGKIIFILHVEIDPASKEYVQATVYIHKGDGPPPEIYNLLYGPPDGPQSYYNVELATVEGGNGDVPMLGPTGRPLAMLTQKVYTPLYTTEVVVDGLTFITAINQVGSRPSAVVNSANFNIRAIFPWGQDMFLVRMDHGVITETRNNPKVEGVAEKAITSWLPANTDNTELPASLCPTGEIEWLHWDLLLPVGAIMKLIIHTDPNGLIAETLTFPGVAFNDQFAYVELLRASTLHDEDMSVHYVPPTLNCGTVDDNGIDGEYHIPLFELKAEGGYWADPARTIWHWGAVYCDASNLSDLNWGSDLWAGANMDDVTYNQSGRVFKGYNKEEARYDFRLVKAGANMMIVEGSNEIEVSFDPANLNGMGVKCGTGSMQFNDCDDKPVFTLAWVNGLVTTGTTETKIMKLGSCEGVSSALGPY